MDKTFEDINRARRLADLKAQAPDQEAIRRTEDGAFVFQMNKAGITTFFKDGELTTDMLQIAPICARRQP